MIAAGVENGCYRLLVIDFPGDHQVEAFEGSTKVVNFLSLLACFSCHSLGIHRSLSPAVALQLFPLQSAVDAVLHVCQHSPFAARFLAGRAFDSYFGAGTKMKFTWACFHLGHALGSQLLVRPRSRSTAQTLSPDPETNQREVPWRRTEAQHRLA